MNTFLMTPRPRLLRVLGYSVLALIAVAINVALAHVMDVPGLLIANTFATPSWVMRKAVARLVNRTVFGSSACCNRSYDDEFVQKGVKMGDTVTGRLPQRYELTIGAVCNPTPLTDQTFSVKITDQSNIGFEYDTWAATLEVDDYMERYGNPAVDTLVNNIDYTGLQRCYKNVAKVVGTPNVTPGSTGTLPQAATLPYGQAVTKLFNVAVPEPYIAMLNSDMHMYLTQAVQASFNPSPTISAGFRRGEFQNEVLGIEKWYKTQNIATHTIGALGGTPVVYLAGQTGASVVCDGAGATAIPGYFKEGDVVQFAGVYDINPLSHASTGGLKDFVVTADTASIVTTGVVTIPISPSIITSGPWANCSASPANDAAVTCFGHASSYAAIATAQGLIYNKDAFALVMADLVLPRGLWIAERISNAKLGVSIRMLKDHDTRNDTSIARLDTAHGWKTIREELACRICAA